MLFYYHLSVKLKILGCYGSAKGPYRTTAFLINDTILMDAGTVTEVLDYDEIRKIKSVFITHTHIDHIKGLFSLLDEMVQIGKDGVVVHAAREINNILFENVFNNRIWPNFSELPSKDNPLLRSIHLEPEREIEVSGVTFKPILVSHTVYTTGFLVKEKKRGFMFTSDTAETTRFWEIAKNEKEIDFVIADVSFPARYQGLAKASGHMTLPVLLRILESFGLSEIPVYIYHIKPFFIDEIKEEVALCGRKNIFLLEQGATLEV